MGIRIYLSHGTLFVNDSAESAPGNDWTDEHSLQGFARRPTAANVATLIEYGCVDVEDGSPEHLDECERVVAVSVRSDSGMIAMSGVDGESYELWKGRPGWVRVTIGQRRGATELGLEVYVAAEESAKEESTRVRERGEWLRREFVETAQAARY